MEGGGRGDTGGFAGELADDAGADPPEEPEGEAWCGACSFRAGDSGPPPAPAEPAPVLMAKDPNPIWIAAPAAAPSAPCPCPGAAALARFLMLILLDDGVDGSARRPRRTSSSLCARNVARIVLYACARSPNSSDLRFCAITDSTWFTFFSSIWFGFVLPKQSKTRGRSRAEQKQCRRAGQDGARQGRNSEHSTNELGVWFKASNFCVH